MRSILLLVLFVPPIFFIWCGTLCGLHNLEAPGAFWTILGLLNIWAVAKVVLPILPQAERAEQRARF